MRSLQGKAVPMFNIGMPDVHYLYIIPFGVILDTPVLILSMRVISHLRGGIDFGDVELAVFKGAFLVLATLGVQLFAPHGIWVSLLVWLLGLCVLFPSAGVRTALVLGPINWWLSLALVHALNILLGVVPFPPLPFR